jgi:hypothetical protein
MLMRHSQFWDLMSIPQDALEGKLHALDIYSVLDLSSPLPPQVSVDREEREGTYPW